MLRYIKNNNILTRPFQALPPGLRSDIISESNKLYQQYFDNKIIESLTQSEIPKTQEIDDLIQKVQVTSQNQEIEDELRLKESQYTEQDIDLEFIERPDVEETIEVLLQKTKAQINKDITATTANSQATADTQFQTSTQAIADAKKIITAQIKIQKDNFVQAKDKRFKAARIVSKEQQTDIKLKDYAKTYITTIPHSFELRSSAGIVVEQTTQTVTAKRQELNKEITKLIEKIDSGKTTDPQTCASQLIAIIQSGRIPTTESNHYIEIQKDSELHNVKIFLENVMNEMPEWLSCTPLKKLTELYEAKYKDTHSGDHEKITPEIKDFLTQIQEGKEVAKILNDLILTPLSKIEKKDGCNAFSNQEAHYKLLPKPTQT